MKLEQSFEVAAPLERVWEALIDVERVAPCLPGASVTARNDDGSYNGEFKVKIGPTSAAYSGKLNMENVDAGAHTATMQAAGTDKRGQGGAKATIVSTVTPAGDGRTTVEVATDYHITGRLARFGRGGMIEEISNRLLGTFSENLQAMLADGGEAAPVPAAAPAAASPATEPDSPATEPDSPATEPDSPATEPDTPETEPDTPASFAAPEAPAPAPENEPLSVVSLVGSVVLRRVKDNPVPFAALVVGFLLAMRVFRRRG
jgi:carbon monoxide dehydrogenase subunit G